MNPNSEVLGAHPPCYGMNTSLGPGAEQCLKGRGGLRCRILTDGVLPGAHLGVHRGRTAAFRLSFAVVLWIAAAKLILTGKQPCASSFLPT